MSQDRTRVLHLTCAGLLVLATCTSCGNRNRGDLGVTLRDLTANPPGYIGQSVSVTGPVTRVISPGVFVMGPSSEQVLVISATERTKTPSVRPGQTVTVDGVVRLFTRQQQESGGASSGNTGDTAMDTISTSDVTWQNGATIAAQQIKIIVPR